MIVTAMLNKRGNDGKGGLPEHASGCSVPEPEAK